MTTVGPDLNPDLSGSEEWRTLDRDSADTTREGRDAHTRITTANRRPRLRAAVTKLLLTLVATVATTTAIAAPATAKVVWIPRAGYRIAAYVRVTAPRSCSATASRTTTISTTAPCRCSRGTGRDL